MHKRQKSTAVLNLLDPGAVLARLSVPITQTTAEIIETSVAIMITMPPAVPDRDQDPRVESGEYTGRTSARLTVYPGLSMRIICFKLQLCNNVSEAAVDELLEMLIAQLSDKAASKYSPN